MGGAAINDFLIQEAVLERSSLLLKLTWLVEAGRALDAVTEPHMGRSSLWKGMEWVDTRKEENQVRLIYLGKGTFLTASNPDRKKDSDGKDTGAVGWGLCERTQCPLVE